MGLMILPMAMDWSIQRFLNINSNNTRRFITGLLGGFGIGFIQLKLVITALQMLWEIIGDAHRILNFSLWF
jgi:uncharacterized membrane protein